jgi:hypothetical protein
MARLFLVLSAKVDNSNCGMAVDAQNLTTWHFQNGSSKDVKAALIILDYFDASKFAF